MLDKISISKETGEVINVELVSMFLVPETKKQFVITTTNEIDPNGLVKLHVSELKDNKLTKIEVDEDWAAIKAVMRSIISSSVGNFKYIPAITTATSPTDYTRGIAVQIVAKEQLANDYKNKKPTKMSAAPVETTTVDIMQSAPTQVMTETNISDPNGSVVAPGIIETPSQTSNFEKVPAAGNPTDLIIENNPIVPSIEENNVLPPVEIATEEPLIDINANQIMNNTQEVITPLVSSTEVKEPVIATVQPQPAIVQPVIPQTTTPPMVDPILFQQMFQQMMMMQQAGMVPQVQPVNNQVVQTPTIEPVTLTEADFEIIANEAKDVFMESAKNLADVIIANAYDKIRVKEADLSRKEIILAQREAAINQQTMAGFQQPKMTVPNNNTGNKAA